MAGSVIGCSQELKGRNERRVVQPQNRVDSPNVTKLVGVREMLAVPGHEEFTPVIRGQRQVQRITERIGWHDAMLNVRLDDFQDGRVNGDDWQR